MSSRKTLLCLIVLLCPALWASLSAQPVTISLKEALNRITKEKKTRFVYERNVVDGITVSYDWNNLASRPTEQILKDVLTPASLTYLRVGSNYYAIKKQNPAPKSSEPKVGVVIQARQPDTSRLPVSVDPDKGGAVIAGVVIEQQSRKPVEAATIQVVPFGMWAVTDKNGRFEIRNVPLGKVTVVVNSMSMIPVEREFNLTSPIVYNAPFVLSTDALSLKEVQVVARESKHGSTSSVISKAAIEHLQATSIADVLQLLPGGIAKNPDLGGVNRVSLRQVNADNVGSLGTSIIVNGAPVSNNANLQVSNTATAGTGASFATSSGGGMDLRQFSADNIESIEVIRGIPSVEHGDLTSGAIIVKTKAGEEPFHLKARINPRITQLWGGKGFKISDKAGSIFADVDYTRSFDDQRFSYKGYSRVTGNVIYSKTFGTVKPLATTTSFSYAMNLDDEKQDPDDKRYQRKTKAQDYNYRFNTSGRWTLNKKFSREINYNISASYNVQKGFQQELLSGYTYPITFELKDTTVRGQYVPSEYVSQLWIEGKPLNVFAKVNNTFFHRGDWLNHRVIVGADWRTDGNFGEGKVYDWSRPPRMLSNTAFRPRSYKDIPVLNQLAFYAEDNMVADVLGRRMALQAGVRFDNIQPTGIWTSKFGTVASPRLNFSYEILKNFNLRAGYGVTAKAPTLLYLYPQEAYYDLVSYNYYSSNPDESLVMITTRVINTENPDLKIMKTNKREVGFDWNFAPRKRLTVMGFYEKTKNGYEMSGNIPRSFTRLEFPVYETKQTRPGEVPLIEFDSTGSFYADYNVPTNNVTNTNKGIELDLDLGRFDAIRTSFVLNGAWINSTSVSSDYYTLKRSQSGQEPKKIAVYDKGRGRETERINTTLRMIHNIPELKFIVTLAVQTIWSERNKYLNYFHTPVAYIDASNGQFVHLTKDQQDQITDADRELYNPFGDEYYKTESWKPVWLFNLRLTKEIGKGVGFSFFANNVFANNPLHRSNRWPDSYERRNPALFFGTEINVKF